MRHRPEEAKCRCDCFFERERAIAEVEARTSQIYRLDMDRLKRVMASSDETGQEIIQKYNCRNQELYSMMVRVMEDYELAMRSYMSLPTEAEEAEPSGKCECACRYKGHSRLWKE